MGEAYKSTDIENEPHISVTHDCSAGNADGAGEGQRQADREGGSLARSRLDFYISPEVVYAAVYDVHADAAP